MKIFVAGATGAIGKSLVPMLISGGHCVTGMIRSKNKASELESQGATAIVADGLDANAVAVAVERARPDVIIHEMTAIPPVFDPRKFAEQLHMTNRLRTEGADNLLAAARAVAVRRFIAQSYAGWPFARTGGSVKTESDPLDSDPPKAMRETLDAIKHLESVVQNAPGIEGLVLRYGALYGPNTGLSEDSATLQQVKQRKFPIVGTGAGVWSFIHVDDAASATVAAVKRGAPGIYNIVDDEPAPVRQWLAALAEIVGAKPPMRLPGWLARLMLGAPGMVMMEEVRGASNQKAKSELCWQPTWPTWRQGFRHALAATAVKTDLVGSALPSPHPR